MSAGSFRFEHFTLDPRERRLLRDDVPVELNSRYFDALALLLREPGMLVSKQRFLDEVWRGVAVTDEALTQCIKTLRRQLGDDAMRPRFIETVPKHGYRFIAPVATVNGVYGHTPAAMPVADTSGAAHPQVRSMSRWQQCLLLGGAGTIGAGVAGMLGGLFYGFAGASQPLQPGMGEISMLLVLVSLSIVVALTGGAGVSFGIAVAGRPSGRPTPWTIVGGAAGGLLVGAFGKLLGLDAFSLLLGRSPGDITGAVEGAVLGGAVGLGAWLASVGLGGSSFRRSVALAGVAGGVAGMIIPLLGGRLLGGSLELLSRRFPDSRLRLDQIGGLFGEAGFGPISQVVTGILEGALFGSCIVGAMLLARRSFSPER